MRGMKIVSTKIALMAALLGAGCGGGATPTGTGGTCGASTGAGGTNGVFMGTGRYLPLKVDATWIYKLTDTSTAGCQTRTTRVEALEAVGGMKPGVTAFRLREADSNGSAQVSWQEDQTDKVVRHREQSFDTTGVMTKEEWYAPSRLRVDETAAHIVMGTMWNDVYTETQIATGAATTTTPKTDKWAVEATDELVTVPAGTFSCMRVHRVGQMTATGLVDKTYWFARGVGKVKEVGGGATEELRSYTIP